MNSNEVKSLETFLDMIGGSNEYKGAVLVAALINTFKDSISYWYTVNDDPKFYIHIETEDKKLDVRYEFSKTYLYLFEEEQTLTNDN